MTIPKGVKKNVSTTPNEMRRCHHTSVCAFGGFTVLSRAEDPSVPVCHPADLAMAMSASLKASGVALASFFESRGNSELVLLSHEVTAYKAN